jgi:site-specific recombinase XerD
MEGIGKMEAVRYRIVTIDEQQALFRSCAEDGSAMGIRDGAVLALAFGGGMRPAEIRTVEAAEWFPERRKLVVRHDKYGNDRTVILCVGAANWIDEWIEVRGRGRGLLLCPTDGTRRVTNRPVAPETLLRIVHDRARAAAIREFSVHDTRRTWVTTLILEGADPMLVAKMGGIGVWTSIQSLFPVTEHDLRSVADLIHIPFPRKPLAA